MPRSSPARSCDRWLPGAIRVVYEDHDVIVVDKPVGLLTARGEDSRAGTAAKSLFDALKEDAPRVRRSRDADRKADRTGVFIVHRLDRDASGLLVFAKNMRALDWLKEDFRAKRVNRVYMAVVEGTVGEQGHAGTIQSFLKEDFRGHVRSIQMDAAADDPADPKLAVTHYTVVGVGKRLTLVKVKLETGRKNQIRVHFAEQGHPLAGDSKHGAMSDPLKRLGLHATELAFTHPATGAPMQFLSPAPPVFWKSVGIKTAPEPQPGSQQEQAPRSKHAGAPAETSWDEVASWYDELVEGADGQNKSVPSQAAPKRGNDHYEHVIVPGALRLLGPRTGMGVLDVACGQGIVSRRLAGLGCDVLGVDASPRLVAVAVRRAGPRERYEVCDARDLSRFVGKNFDAAACIMALGNIDPLDPVMKGIAGALRPGGSLVLVVSHPAFRAASQTSWGWDETARMQYRRVDGYLSNGQAPIKMHPGSAPAVTTWSFHRPIQSYVKALGDAGMLVAALEEWPGRRESTSGPRAAEENRSRREIPLFLGIRAVKADTASN
ncbi:MAG: methyltransferase domain-containing protein [Phycisphaerales bacterium]|nr:methyltransferase domain-containing protein [Phycisphaerales bacterium]